MSNCSKWPRCPYQLVADTNLMFALEKFQSLSYGFPIGSQPITICNSDISVVDSIKDLGPRFSWSFNFTAQALYPVEKARELTHLVLRSLHINDVRIAIYKRWIRPLLRFCPVVVSHLPKSHRYAIELVQRKVTKSLLPYNSLLNYQARCQTFRLKPLQRRRLKL